MANIVRRNDYSSAPLSEWDPLRFMREMMRWDPFRMAQRSGMGLDQYMQDQWMPNFEVRETGNEIRILADVPAVKREDLDISLSGNRLVVSGHRECEERGKDESFHTYERQYGQFVRTFTLPDNADLEHVKSELRDGVLTILVPMSAASKSRKIQIGGASPKS
ncbi:MAG TPA: HSP20 family small heat-shock protein [Kofleriaceae bacterium]|nr:HSP20 family small heat-shock protein [Kofleriaceae bacterium]